MKKTLSQLTFLTLFSAMGIFTDPASLLEGKLEARSLQAQTVEEQADRLLQQGIQQYRRSQFREAAQSWEQALKLYQEIEDRAGIANSLNNLGIVSRRLGNYEQAIDYYQRSLAIAEEIGDRAGIASSLNNLGVVSKNLGEYEEAMDYHQRSLAIREEIGDRAGVYRSLNNLGLVSQNLGNYKEARDYFQRALAINEEIGDRAGVSYVLHNLGAISESLGEYEKAMDYHQRSLAIAEEIGDHTRMSASLNNLGNIASRLGKYEEAMDFFFKSLTIAKQLEDRISMSEILNDIGIVLYQLGEYKKAIDYYQKSLIIKKATENEIGVSRTLNNLGSAYESLRNYEKAIKYYQESLAISESIKYNLGSAYTLGNLGELHRKLENHKKALKYYKQSLNLSEEINDPYSLSKSLVNLGVLYADLNHYKKAFEYYQKSLGLTKRLGDRNGEALAYNNIASLLEQQNQPTTAIVFYKESVNLYEQIRKDIRGLSPEEQKSYLSTVEHTYRSLADLLLSQGRILEAQEVLELLKVQEITEYTRTGEAGGDEPAEIAANLQETEVLDTHGRLISLGRKIMDCEETNCADSTYSQLLDDQEAVADQFQTVVRQLEATIQERRANDKAFLDPNQVPVAVSKIVEAQPNSVLIYPLVLEDKLWILWASEGGITSSIEVNTVGEKELSQTVLALRQMLQNPNSNIKELQEISKQLYDWLIPPQLATELEENNIENLVFSLDHVTRYIPIDVLFDGQDYLLKNYTISTILSAELTDLDESQSDSPSILAGGLSNAVEGFNPLPNVPQELDTIVLNQDQDPLGVYAGEVFLNQDLTKDTIRDNLRRHNILHLATHGKFVPGSKYDSYLLLGNGEKYPIPDIQNLRNLDQLDLVVLSACETALGGEGNDGTEIAGISYYFLNNGADAVVASLWQVNDASTRLLMELFYQNLNEGMGKAEALRQAKLSLMSEDEQLANNLSRAGVAVTRAGQPVNDQGFEHPYYWSSFILIGNRL
jgi:CHAT domain-containing protein/Tfp pilus assembly protein PilF